MSSVIWESLRVEPLLLLIERSQLRLLGRLIRMSPQLPPVGDVLGTASWEETPRRTETEYSIGNYLTAMFQYIVEHPILQFLIMVIALVNCVIISAKTISRIAKMFGLCGVMLFEDDVPFAFGDFPTSVLAIDRNEFQEIRQKLMKIVDEVRNLPINKERELQAQTEKEMATTLTDNLLGDDIASGHDILSTFIALEESGGAFKEQTAADRVSEEMSDRQKKKKKEEVREEKALLSPSRQNQKHLAMLKVDQSVMEEVEEPGEGFMELLHENTEYNIGNYISAMFQYIVEHPIVQFLILVIALLNCIIISVQTNSRIAKDHETAFLIWEWIIFTAFISEIVLKFTYGFRIFWMSGWNVLDFLVSLGLMVGYRFLPPSQNRIIRTLRLFRSVRLFAFSEGFSRALNSIARSMSALLNIFILIMCFMVMFGLCGVMLFGDEVPSAFGDFPTALYTLFICITQNGWFKIYYGFKGVDEALRYAALVYFFIFIFSCGFIFLNFFSSVIITNQELAVETDSTKSEEDESQKDLVHVDEVVAKTSMTQRQTPWHDSCLTNLTLENFENLVLLREAIDRNEKEFQEIRQKLIKIVEEVRNLPVNKERELQAQREKEMATTLTDNLLGDDIASGQAGDILSTFIALEEANLLDSRTTTDVFGEGLVQEGIRRLAREAVTDSLLRSKSSVMSVTHSN
ncbi:cation channel sperm-associated protein 4-like [Salminus brasiliensis]|uniref:cation channel sperm-associated protein 4-like n=2 Tax=Salminus brasiliensis TaxID=930266 RepID=UPI003B82CCA1